jgi:tetratricopeptide (TPR) repeat protein
MKTISIKIEDVTRILNPVMIPDVTELDEVVVKKSRRRSQKDLEDDYSINKNIIRTAWGYLDADRAAGNVRTLDEDEIFASSICILDVLRNRFPGIRVIGSCTTGGSTAGIGEIRNGPSFGGSVFIRGASSLANPNAAIFDVDGQIFSDAPIWIDVANIKRIAILGNLATTVAYGNIGRGGVIVINTINGNPRLKETVDRARLRNNFLKSKVLTAAEVEANMPTYLKELRAAATNNAAKAIFEKSDNLYSNSPYFYLDAYKHFYGKWNDKSFADEIIDVNFKLFRNNAVLLKAMAYIYEEQERFEKANEVFKEVFVLRPNYAQSYMDMANSYRNLKENKQAAAIYSRYEYLLNEGFLEADTVGFGPMINREFNNLLMLNKETVVNEKKAKKLFVEEEEFEGTRLVFEWNDSEAEFDLQFVNPGNQYHTWKHSLADNAEVINREKEFGYNVTEYLMDGSLPGNWQINVNYFGNKSLTPTYLKATVYHNYGSKTQRKEVKVFTLTLKDVNQELFKLNIGAKMSTQ